MGEFISAIVPAVIVHLSNTLPHDGNGIVALATDGSELG